MFQFSPIVEIITAFYQGNRSHQKLESWALVNCRRAAIVFGYTGWLFTKPQTVIARVGGRVSGGEVLHPLLHGARRGIPGSPGEKAHGARILVMLRRIGERRHKS